jgi:hypothetical protein
MGDTGLRGQFGRLRLTAPERFRLPLVLPAHPDISGRRGIQLGGAVVAHVVPLSLVMAATWGECHLGGPG